MLDNSISINQYLQNLRQQAPLITELAEKDLENVEKEQLDELDISAHHLVITDAVKPTVSAVEVNIEREVPWFNTRPRSSLHLSNKIRSPLKVLTW